MSLLTQEQLRSKNGIYFTQGMFYEFNNLGAPLTLREKDFTSRKGTTYISLYQIFMECVDDYDFAEKVFGSQEHLRKLLGLDWFANGGMCGTWEFTGFDTWQQDKKRKEQSKMLKLLEEQAAEGNTVAQKHLFDFYTKSKALPVGRKIKKRVSKPNNNVSSLATRMKKING